MVKITYFFVGAGTEPDKKFCIGSIKKGSVNSEKVLVDDDFKCRLWYEENSLQEAVVNGVLFVGTPFMFLMSIVYSIWLVGSPALVGSFAVFLFYPIMVGKKQLLLF